MSKLKRVLLPLFLCLVLVMSMALTACGETPDDTDDDPPVTEPGGEQPGGEQPGGEQPGGEQPGGEQPGGEQPGGEQPGGQQPGGQQPGGQQPEGEKPAFTIPEIDLSKWNTIGLKLTDLDVKVDQPEWPADSGIVDATVFELYVTLDEDGMLQGYGKANMTMTNAQVDNALVANVYIEDSVIYVAAEGDALSPSSNEGFDVYATVELSEVPQLQDIAESLMGAQMALETVLPEIETWVNETLAPVFKKIEIDEDAIENFVTKLINSFFKVTENQDGTKTITFSLDIVKEWNETLSTTTIAGFVDLIAGEGSFASIKEKVTNGVIYTYSVADVIEFIETDIGVNLVELIEAVEAFLPTVMEMMGAPEVESITIEQFINGMSGEEMLPEGAIKGMLENEKFLALDVEYALLMIYFEGEIPEDDESTTDVDEAAEEITAALEEIKADISDQVAMLETMTVYDIISSMQGSLHPNPESKPDDNTNEPPVQEETDKVLPIDDEEEPTPAEQAAAMIDQMLDMVGKYFSITITTDADGVVTGIVIAVDVEIENVTVDMTITVNDEKVVIEFEETMEDSYTNVDADATVEIIPGYTVTPDANKLAQIKAELEKAPEITVEFAEDIFESYVEDRSDYKLVVDTVNDWFYIVDIDDISENGTAGSNNYYIVRGYITAIESLEVMAMSVQKGCTNMIAVSPVFNGIDYYFESSFEVPADTDKSHYDRFEFDLTLIQSLMEKTEDKQNVSESYNFVYNTQTNTIVTVGRYDQGHVYEETACETYDGCDDIYAITYTCAVCRDTYNYYTTQGHWYETTYELVNETAGPLGGYRVVKKCMRPGCTHSEVLAEIDIATVDSDVSLESHPTHGYYSVTFKITVATAGTYRVHMEALSKTEEGYIPTLRCGLYKQVTKVDEESGKTEYFEHWASGSGGNGSVNRFDANEGDVYLFSFSVETDRNFDTVMQYVINIVKETDDFNIEEI